MFSSLLDILIVCDFIVSGAVNIPVNHILRYVLNYVLEKVSGSEMMGSKGLNFFRALIRIAKLLSKKAVQLTLPVS